MMMMMQLVIGIDGGGTKTEAIAIDLERNILLRLTGESTNPHAVTFPTALSNLCTLLDALSSSPEVKGAQWKAIVLGLSGISTKEEQDTVYQYLQIYREERGLHFDCSLQNDAQIALMATLGREEGIVAISGTGSIVFGLTPAAEQYRAGGWGHVLGDEGSGYDIGLRTLKAVTRSCDGILPPTRMTELLLQEYGFSAVSDLRSYIYKDSVHKSDIAKFAEIGVLACEQGDSAAFDLVTQSARDLAAAAIAVIGKNEWFAFCDLVITGSIFKHSPTYARTFYESVSAANPGIKLHASANPPAYGAALLALKRFGSQDDYFIMNSLKESDTHE
jgi:N-acetylglucosamine kinase-like BadF-type ATPase